ncbi:DUF523 domain-containing protein [Hathewaya limosa]|uniref:Uncharacterized protein YbbK (DUF523 family) n=1 Tax=Hathewaya limosa TaxID=1536 RepID=A0ABU0JUN1_HATLI|nr:DUF523 domain-containing protein [Hathewaya limosa]MDQ0479622.1 uncharacterized protein YbbK (DUF523 family) [Hathewaya limosa]
MILISACLCGINCKYNGENNLNENILELIKNGKAIPVCPEQLGGLCTPRVESEIKNGTGKEVLYRTAQVVDKDGNDVTENFIRGANEALKIAKSVNAKIAILKSNSPSCGFGKIYDGSFKGNKIDGNGVTTALLLENDIKVFTEHDVEKFLLDIKR